MSHKSICSDHPVRRPGDGLPSAIGSGAGRYQTALTPQVSPKLWFAKLSATQACIYSRTESASHGGQEAWRFAPEPGMRLDIPVSANGEAGGSAQLARLLAGIVNAARAGRRFERLIVVGEPALRAALVRYFDHDTVTSIVAQIDCLSDLWSPDIAAVLYSRDGLYDAVARSGTTA